MELSLVIVAAAAFIAAGLTMYSGFGLVIVGTVAAFAGVLVARKFLHKVTMASIQTLVGILLFGVAIGLITGLI